MTALAIFELRPCVVILGVLGLVAPACGTSDDRPPVWEYISPVLLQPNCATASCHSRATAVAGLDFSHPDRGYTSLTGLRVAVISADGTVDESNARPLVTPFDPGQSRVVHMLRARGAARMPPDRPLAEADIRLIERWILRGASKTAGGTASDAGAPRDGGGSDAGTPDSGAGGDAGVDQAGDGGPRDTSVADTLDSSSDSTADAGDAAAPIDARDSAAPADSAIDAAGGQ